MILKVAVVVLRKGYIHCRKITLATVWDLWLNDFATGIRHGKFSEFSGLFSKHKWLVQKQPRNSKLQLSSVLETEIHILDG